MRQTNTYILYPYIMVPQTSLGFILVFDKEFVDKIFFNSDSQGKVRERRIKLRGRKLEIKECLAYITMISEYQRSYERNYVYYF